MKNKTYLAFGAVFCVMTAMAISYYLLWHFAGRPGSNVDIVRYYRENYIPETLAADVNSAIPPDIRPQRFMYLFGVLLVYGVFLLISFARVAEGSRTSFGLPAYSAKVSRWVARSGIIFILGLVFLLAAGSRPRNDHFVPVPVWAVISGVVLIFVIGYVVNSGFRVTVQRRLIVDFILIILAIEVLSFWFEPDLSNQPYSVYTVIQRHFSVIVGPADDLGARLPIYRDTYPYYGILQTAITAMFVKLWGALSWGSYYRILQSLQIAMFALLPLSLLLWSYARRHILRWLVLPCLFALPTMFGLYWMNWWPNHTGWRMLNLGVAPLALFALQKADNRSAAVILGIVAALEVSYNQETAIVGICAFIAFLVTASERPGLRQGLGYILRMALSYFITLFLLCSLYRIFFGEWPFPTSVAQEVDFYTTLSNPWFGFELTGIDLVAIVIFGHAAFIVIRAALMWRQGNLFPKYRVQLAIATMIIAWFSYYIKLPQTVDLHTELYLYAFLIPLCFEPRLLALGWRHGLPRPAGFLIIPAFLTAFTLAGWSEMFRQIHEYYDNAHNHQDAAKLSGVWVRAAIGDEVSQQAAFLKNFAGDHAIYLSNSAFVMPILTGIYQDLPTRSPFTDIFSRYQFDELIRRIRELDPPLILFDVLRPGGQAPWSGSAAFSSGNKVDNQQLFYARVQSALGGDYTREGENAGWEIWRRRQKSQ